MTQHVLTIYVESTTQQWRKSAPPILSTSHCEFNGARSCAHARKTILLTLIHPFTTHIVPSLYPQSFPSSSCRSFPPVFLFGRYKGLPSMNNIFMRVSFFFLILLSFSSHTFRGLAGAYVNPGRFSPFVHSLVCPITHSSLDGFQPNLVQHFPHPSFTCHTVFSLKNTLECLCERLLHCRLIFAITWTPDKSFA